jgi:hypothetical protein
VDQQATGRERTGPGVNVDAGRLSGSPGVTTFLKPGGSSKPAIFICLSCVTEHLKVFIHFGCSLRQRNVLYCRVKYFVLCC